MLHTQPLTGSIVAIVTPMQDGGGLDLTALKSLIDWHIGEGTAGIVIVGTTGESPTVTVDEHQLLIRTAVEHAAGRVPVIAGVGANATAEAIALTRYAHSVGAAMGLSVSPYYNKPMQEGLYRHFAAIAASCPLPIIVYNVPGRTVSDVSNDTLLRLCEIPTIVGLKDATGDLVRHVDLMRRLRAVRPDFALYSGNDDTALPYMLLGGHGVISVTANVAPRAMAELCRAARDGKWRLRVLNERLMPLHTKLFIEANPIAVKWGLAAMGRIRNELRLPMTPLSAQFHDVVRGALRDAGAVA